MSKVFISYRQENDAHSAKVRELALKLRAGGIEVIHDGLAQEEQFNGNQPPNGWGFWSIQQASNAASVLIIGSEGWFRVLNSPDPISDGLGAAAEATCVFQRLYRGGALNEFGVIGFFDYAKDLETLPYYMDGKCGRYDLAKESEIARLITWLKRLPAPATTAVAPPTPVTAYPSQNFPDPVPAPNKSGFVDCTTAFAGFERLLAHDARRRILLLEAEGEHGKSTLVTRFFDHAIQTLPANSTAFVSFPEVPGSIDRHLNDIADQLGITTLSGANSHEKTRNLLTARAGLPTLIFFDHFERAVPELADWVTLFFNRAINQPLLRVVVAGRRVPAHQTQAWGIYTEHVQCDPLAEPEAFVKHAADCGSSMPPEKIKICCELLRSQRDSRKRLGKATDGFSPLALLNEIDKCRNNGGATQ